MEESKIEIVKYQKVKHIKVFVNKINYVENHIHNDIEIFIVLSGKGSIKLNSTEQKFSVGDMFLINSGDVHSLSSYADEDGKFFEDSTSLFIQISNHFAREYFPKIRTLVFESLNLKNVLKKEDYQEMLSLLILTAVDYFSETDYFELDVVSNVSKVLTILLKNVNHEIINEVQKIRIQKQQRRLERIISYIDDNFDSKIKLEDIAIKENLSLTYLSHLLSENFGMSFQEFINVKRMEQCIRLMANKEKTLLEIALESGFSDSKYMNKVFLDKLGCTPKEYRKKNSFYVEDSQIKTSKLEVIYNDSISLQKVKEFAENYHLLFMD